MAEAHLRSMDGKDYVAPSWEKRPVALTRRPLETEHQPPSMPKILHLRSTDGKVYVAPSWDKRPAALTRRPLETGVPSRALGRVLNLWTKHALAELSGETRASLAAWDVDFLRRLDNDGLRLEFAAAVQQLQNIDALAGILPDFTRYGTLEVANPIRAVARAATRADVAAAARLDLAVAWCAADADPATALRAAGSDPVGAWAAATTHARSEDAAALPDQRAASRARGRQKAEEFTCHHCKRKHRMAAPGPAAAPTASFPPPELLKGTATAPPRPLLELLKGTAIVPPRPPPPASSLRARRGLPELSCKPPPLKLLVAGEVKPLASVRVTTQYLSLSSQQ